MNAITQKQKVSLGKKEELKPTLKEKLESNGIKFQALSLFVDMTKRHAEADALIDDVGSRHDVPTGDWVPKDLQDKIGTWKLTKDGYPVSGRILSTDLNIGSESPVAIALLVGWAFLIPMLATLGIVGKMALTAYIFVMYAYFGFFATVGMALFIVFPSLVLSYFPSLQEISKQVLPISIASLIALIPMVLPFIAWKFSSSKRAKALLARSIMDRHFININHKTKRNATRWAQAKNAFQDKTKFIRLGTAKGSFDEAGDVLAPETYLPYGLSVADLSKHMIIFGSTGTGKTSSAIRPIIKAIIEDENK